MKKNEFAKMTPAIRKMLRAAADEVGAVELLRVVAQLICYDTADMHAGIEARIELNKIANKLST